MDRICQDFLERQIAEATALASASDLLKFLPAPFPSGEGGLPNHFVAEFRCKGLVKSAPASITEFDQWLIGIRIPENYLRTEVHVAEILTYLGPAPGAWHPNISFRAPFICLHLKPGMPLVEILFALFDLLTWNNFAAQDALNQEASQWARSQPPGRFPIDRRPLKRRAATSHGIEVAPLTPPP
jgi:hypothetical protein